MLLLQIGVLGLEHGVRLLDNDLLTSSGLSLTGLHRSKDRIDVGTIKVILGLLSLHTSSSVGEDVLLECSGFSGDPEGDHLDGISAGSVALGNLAQTGVARNLGGEGEALLRLGRAILTEVMNVTILVGELEVLDAVLTLATKEQNVVVMVIVREDVSGSLTKISLGEGFAEVLRVVELQLAHRALGETDAGKPTVLGNVRNRGFLASLEGLELCDAALVTRVEETNSLILTGSGHLATITVPCDMEQLIPKDIINIKHTLSSGDIPKLDGTIKTARGEDIVRCRVPSKLSDFLLMAVERGQRAGDILGDSFIGNQRQLDAGII
jgi:hypothetical protein